MYKQIIIARKDLNMSVGKLAAQVSHASMAFLTKEIKDDAFKMYKIDRSDYFYYSLLGFDKYLFEQWFQKDFTKCILKAKKQKSSVKSCKGGRRNGFKRK